LTRTSPAPHTHSMPIDRAKLARAAQSDPSVVAALRVIKRRVSAGQGVGGPQANRSSGGRRDVGRPLSPLNSNPCRFTTGMESIESDYQYMCRTGAGAAVTEGFPATYRRFSGADGGAGQPAGDSATDSFRELMALPSLTARERRLANRVPGKQYAPNGRAVYPWDANGGMARPDNIAVLDGYRYTRNGNPVDGCSAEWSARREVAANRGVRVSELPEHLSASWKAFQLSDTCVPTTNAARRNYPISARTISTS
jgi:hypothetical protein